MIVISKNVYIDQLNDIVNKYNNISQHNQNKTCWCKIKHIYWYIDKDPKFKIGDIAKYRYFYRISKYKNIFAKGYVPNWSEEVFMIKNVKNIVPWTYVINNLNEEEIVGSFYGKELQKINQKQFRIEKVVERKDYKLYVKWKG